MFGIENSPPGSLIAGIQMKCKQYQILQEISDCPNVWREEPE